MRKCEVRITPIKADIHFGGDEEMEMTDEDEGIPLSARRAKKKLPNMEKVESSNEFYNDKKWRGDEDMQRTDEDVPLSLRRTEKKLLTEIPTESDGFHGQHWDLDSMEKYYLKLKKEKEREKKKKEFFEDRRRARLAKKEEKRRKEEARIEKKRLKKSMMANKYVRKEKCRRGSAKFKGENEK